MPGADKLALVYPWSHVTEIPSPNLKNLEVAESDGRTESFGVYGICIATLDAVELAGTNNTSHATGEQIGESI